MKVIGLSEWREILDREKPRIVVADLWASWCVSCIERFPRMVEMADRFGTRDGVVRFLTLNLDDPKDRSGIDWANDFLAQTGGNLINYRLSESLTLSFEVLDIMSLPVVLIYDGEGEERYRLTNDNPNHQFTEADVEKAISDLLSE